MSGAESALLLTGANGALGRELLVQLAAGAEKPVVCVVRSPEQGEHLLSTIPPGADVTFVMGDIAAEKFVPDVTAQLRAPISDVIHAAADVRWKTNDDTAWRTNVEGTENVLAFAATQSVDSFLYVSSAFVCGTQTGSIDERTPPAESFSNPYERSKLGAERTVAASGLPALVVRPPIIVGRSTDGAIGRFNVLYPLLAMWERGQLPLLIAEPTATLDLVPVDWVARMMLRLLARGARGTIQLTSGSDAPTIREAAIAMLSSTNLLRHMSGLAQHPLPRLVTPDTFERLHRPMAEQANARRELRTVRAFETYMPYVTLKRTFGNGLLRRTLGESYESPPVFTDYAPVVANYWWSTTRANEPKPDTCTQKSATDSAIDLHERYLSSSLARIFRFTGGHTEVRGEGPYVHMLNGDRFVDLGGYGVCLFGHRHPAVVGAVTAALDRMPLSSRVVANATVSEAARALVESAPGLSKVTFVNSGAEAVELAMKTCVLRTGRGGFIALEHAFHGKTLGALSLTARERFRQPFAPVLQDVHHVRAGDDDAIAALLAAGDIAGVFVEAVQAEGGIRTVDPEWLRTLAARTHAAGGLFVVDEISTGAGRCGSRWLSDAAELLPHVDMLLAGKALGGGVVPAGAVLFRAEHFEAYDDDPFLHSSTFAGNPLAAAATRAVMELLTDEMLTRIGNVGEAMREALGQCSDEWPTSRVRGAGLLLGVEFETEAACGFVLSELLEQNYLVVPALNDRRCIRLTPPVVLGDVEIERFASCFATAKQHALKARRHIESEGRH
jgi:putrescine aminotransferase